MLIPDLNDYHLRMVRIICEAHKGIPCNKCELYGQCPDNYSPEKIEKIYKSYQEKDITVTESEILCCLGEYDV